jgi:peptide/nickel transport system permease protein
MAAVEGWLRRAWAHDLAWSFRHSPVTVLAAFLTLVCVGSAVFAPWIAPQNPFDSATLNLNDGFTPPAWTAGGSARFLLGTDDQGRDILSTIMYGARISLGVGLAAVLFSAVLGVSMGLLSGYLGGRLDAFIMRVADIQLSFPAILIALLIDGVARVALPRELHDQLAVYVLVLAIGVSGWVQYARTVRGSTLVEKNKEYVQAARVIGERRSSTSRRVRSGVSTLRANSMKPRGSASRNNARSSAMRSGPAQPKMTALVMSS